MPVCFLLERRANIGIFAYFFRSRGKKSAPISKIGARILKIGARILKIGAQILKIGAGISKIVARILKIGARILKIGAQILKIGARNSTIETTIYEIESAEKCPYGCCLLAQFAEYRLATTQVVRVMASVSYHVHINYYYG